MKQLRKFSNWWVLAAVIAVVCRGRSVVSRLPVNFRHSNKIAHRIFYQKGNSESDLPECTPMAVCNKVDVYSEPWIERQCRCPGKNVCSVSLDQHDGYTIVDKSRQLKLCQPVSKLISCRYFRNVTWTYDSRPNNTTQQIVNCICPKRSVAYIIKHEPYKDSDGNVGYKYHFACSPQSRIRCQRKEPCRLFTVKKRPDVEEVNTNTLCQCPRGHRCPEHHNEPAVIFGTSYPDDHIRTYSGYCTADVP